MKREFLKGKSNKVHLEWRIYKPEVSIGSLNENGL
jgi:hypothetical protein